MRHANRPARLLLAVVFAAGIFSCAPTVNYVSPFGPRLAGGAGEPIPGSAIRIATMNIKFAQRIGRAAELMRKTPQLGCADILLLQEMDETGVEQLASSLGMDFVYYPAVIHPVNHRDFGNAILSRWPIVRDRKIILPHLGWTRRSQRIAVCATILVRGQPVRVYSVHLATPWELGPRARRDQIRAVLIDAAMSPDPVILGGDMNSSGIGRVVARWGYRWPTRDLGPTAFLSDVDHIFLRGFGAPARAGIIRHNLGASDHRPVWAAVIPGWSVCRRSRGIQGPGGRESPAGTPEKH